LKNVREVGGLNHFLRQIMVTGRTKLGHLRHGLRPDSDEMPIRIQLAKQLQNTSSILCRPRESEELCAIAVINDVWVCDVSTQAFKKQGHPTA